MARPRRSVHLDYSDEEPYQWGNSTGGGGAPLRDKGGLPITNLRKVIIGDESPSPQKPNGQRVGNTNYRGQTEVVKSIGESDGGGGSHDDSRKNGLANGNGKNHKDNYRDFDHAREKEDHVADCHRNRPASIDSPYQGDNSHHSNKISSSNRDQRGSSPAAYPPSSSSPKKFMGSLREMNGLGDREREIKLRKDQEYQQQLRDQIDENKRKKDAERRGADRNKQRELSEYLRVQYKGDLPDHFKGSANDSDTERSTERSTNTNTNTNTPTDTDYPPTGRRGSSNRNYDSSENSNRNQNNERPRSRGTARDEAGNLSSKQRNGDESDGYGEAEDSWGLGNRHEHGHKYGNRKAESLETDHGNGQDMRGRRAGDDIGRGIHEQEQGKKNGGRQQRGQRQDKEGRWVSEAEYEELTALCDRLMSQQDKLQGEIQLQAGLIKDLQRKPQTTGVRDKGTMDQRKNPTLHQATPGQMRSKSVQESRETVNKNMFGGRKGPNGAGGVRRPISTDGSRVSEKDKDRDRNREECVPLIKRGLPKVAFGGSAIPSRGGGGQRSVLSKAGKDTVAHAAVAGSGPGSGSRISGIAKRVTVGLAFGGRAPSQVPAEREKERMGGKGNDFPPKGRGAIVKGPVIVTYDDDEIGNNYSKGNRLKVVDTKKLIASTKGIPIASSSGTSVSGRSRELNGESEYLRVGEREDYISGDQLDRLLVQAKRVRAAPH